MYLEGQALFIMDPAIQDMIITLPGPICQVQHCGWLAIVTTNLNQV